jgi:hypothetical protein
MVSGVRNITIKLSKQEQTRMSRLEAVAKGLYYPTPPRVVAACAAHLHAPVPAVRQLYRLLDPCAGEGLALAALAATIPQARTYGIELNEERGAAARDRLDEVLVLDAYRAMLGNGKFSLLFLNPPYDAGSEAGGRLEHAFLTAFSRTLAPGGLLLFVVPQAILARSARYLVTNFHSIGVWRFPDPEFDTFHQVVIAGTRRERPLPSLDGGVATGPATEGWARPATLAALAEGNLAPLPDTPSTDGVLVATVGNGALATGTERETLAGWWSLPPLPADPAPAFRPAIFEPTLARQAVAGLRGGWAVVRDDLWPAPPPPPVSPLMPLRRGHVAGLLQAGALDGAVLTGHGGRTVVVKGRSVKVLDRTETEDATIERERIATSIVAMDALTGEFTRVGEEATRGEEGGA